MMVGTTAILNARITDTLLGGEDHGAFTFYLYLDYGGSCQWAGGWCIGKWHDQTSVPYLGELLMRIMQIAGVGRWEDLKGKYLKVKASHEKVFAIAPVLSGDDKWLDFEAFFATHKGDK